jgi:hypothetical protein
MRDTEQLSIADFEWFGKVEVQFAAELQQQKP